VYLTGGQACDLDGADALLKDIKASSVLADKAYDADERVRDKLRDKQCVAVIPSRINRKMQVPYDKEVYKLRHFIENFFAKLKQYRGIATRYDKTAQNFLGPVYMVSSIVWLN
jgi:transposase